VAIRPMFADVRIRSISFGSVISLCFRLMVWFSLAFYERA
jgi:hypothetical protein